jgi:uncharacterized membrane protein
LSRPPARPHRQGALRALFALLFIGAGLLHFFRPEAYRGIMPPFLPAPGVLVAVSGIAEIIGGMALLIPRFHRFARFWLIALLVAVFPANVQMLVDYRARGAPEWQLLALWLRLALQLVLIWWVVLATRPPRERRQWRGYGPSAPGG